MMVRYALLALPSLVAISSPACADDAEQVVLPEVTVQGMSYGAGAVQLPSTVSVLDNRQLTEGQRQVNVSETLNRVPGLVVNDRQDYAQDMQLSVRGWGADSPFGVQDVVIDLDGVPLTMPDGQSQIQVVNLPTIGDISVIKGPFAALYGNAAGGVIQAYTRDPAYVPTLELDTWAGAWDSHQTSLIGSSSHGDWGGIAGLTDFSTDGWRQHGAADRHQFNGVLSRNTNSGDTFSLVVNTLRQDAQDPGGINAAALAQDPSQVRAAVLTYDARKTVDHKQLGASWEHRIDADNSLSAGVYGGRRKIVQYLPVNANGVISLDDGFGGGSLRFNHGGSFGSIPYRWSVGTDYGKMDEHRMGYANNYGSIGRLANDQNNSIDNAAEYVQGQIELTSKLSLSAGIRHDRVGFDFSNAADSPFEPGASASTHFSSTDPVAGLLYKLAPGFETYLDYGHGFVTPTSYQLAYKQDGTIGPNLGLQPMHVKNAELGLRGRLGGATVAVAVYDVHADNQIVVGGSNGGRSYYINAGPTSRRGLDLSLDADLPKDLSARLAYSLIDVHFSGGQYDGNVMPGVPRQQLVLGLTWRPRDSELMPHGFYTTLEAQARSRVYVDVANSASAGGWVAYNWSAGLSQNLGKWSLSEFARVDNLFDRRYVDALVIGDKYGNYYEAAPGRNLSAGVKLVRSF